jgi:hypothetical protein
MVPDLMPALGPRVPQPHDLRGLAERAPSEALDGATSVVRAANRSDRCAGNALASLAGKSGDPEHPLRQEVEVAVTSPRAWTGLP